MQMPMPMPSSSSSVRPSVPPNLPMSQVATECRTNVYADLVIYRLILASLALSAVAICASTLMLPILIDELESLNEMATREGKQFKSMADEIWRDLTHLRKKPSNGWQMHDRERRELQMSHGESRGFLDRLERKSYKGRQRMKQSEGEPTEEKQSKQQKGQGKRKEKPPNWELYTKRIPLEEGMAKSKKVPKPNPTEAWTKRNGTALTERGEIEGPTERKAMAKARGVPTYGEKAAQRSQTDNEQRVEPIECPKGPPGFAGKAGHDGIPGVSGVHGKKGKSGDEIQRNFEKDASQCFVCPEGPRGFPGANGPQGEKGENGENGKPGIPKRAPAGAPGKIGEVGRAGRDGTAGKAGTPGEGGTKHLKGRPGPKGDRGQMGDAREAGERGADGTAGATGDVGYPGWPGEAGPPGGKGPVGPIGVPGIAGTEQLYCNCPVRSSQLRRLKDDRPGGERGETFGRWKGRLPTQLTNEYEKYAKENGVSKEKVDKIGGEKRRKSEIRIIGKTIY
ncbi:hypothetical protein niasHT_001859 [Heterodera trifolii]|uniref:Nematode cuticle collagen N-terminal domain-containing protein n=1 Tax=Heterodera trifolii TaxID=157864 RepID=A0ABD2MBT5_9BILA